MRTRSYVGNFTMRLGGLSTVGRLLAIRKTEDKVKLCTEDGSKVTQVYLGPDGTIYPNKDNLYRGIEVKGDSKMEVIGDAKSVTAARASQLPLNEITFTLHKASDVDNHVFASENQGYLFQPRVLRNKLVDPHSLKNYAGILAMMQDPNYCLIGKCNLQHHEGLFRAGLFRNQLYIQKQLYPEKLNEWDLDDVEIDEAFQKAANKSLETFTQDFNPSAYDDTIAARIALLADGGLTDDDQANQDVLDALMEMMNV